MIDLHNHIIFGLDDGAQTFEDTIAMVEMAYNEGTRTFIATPHYHERFQYSMDLMEQNFKTIQDYFNKKHPEMRFYLGNEGYLDERLYNALVSGQCKTLADSRYVLVEISYSAPLYMVKKMLSDIIMSGYRPVIAHCERLIERKEDLAKFEKLKSLGCYFQTNVSIFLKPQKRWLTRIMLNYLKDRTISFVASDAHDDLYRKTVLSEAYSKISKKVGKEIADEVFISNGEKIILNEELE